MAGHNPCSVYKQISLYLQFIPSHPAPARPQPPFKVSIQVNFIIYILTLERQRKLYKTIFLPTPPPNTPAGLKRNLVCKGNLKNLFVGLHQNCHCRSAFHLGKICLKPIKKESPLTKSGILLGLAFKKCRMGHCGNKIN